MAEGFQHITIESDEEELVIQAGVKPQRVAPVEAVVAEKKAQAPQAAPAAQAVKAAAETEDEEDAQAEASLRAVESGAKNMSWAIHSAIAEERAGRPQKEPREYRETTLEDLESTPMPPMQKFVLLGLLCIAVAFGVYYYLHVVAQLF